LREAILFNTDSLQIRCRVMPKGYAVLGEGDSHLDGEAFGKMASDGTPDLDIPHSGDSRKDGDFESWFCLVPD
jgi:hypothetical protein